MTHSLTREQKIIRSQDLVNEAYYQASALNQLVDVRDSRSGEQDFLKLGRRIYIPEEWYSRGDIYYDIALKQLGENIAFSEKKFIIEEILKNEAITRIHLPEINSTVLKHQTEQIERRGFHPTILLAPVDYFVKLTYEWPMADRSFRSEGFDKITISGHSYKTFWSSKYIPFKEFILADKSYGEWVSKPSFKDRFYVKISESDKPDKLDLLMYTTLKFSILEPNKITMLQESEIKQ
jgi:hypothetical protein